MKSLPLASIVFAFILSASPAWARQVRIAERPQAGNFSTIQSGVDAAFEGESLLVAPRQYAPFVVDAKSVRVFVTGGGLATISGRVVVKNLSPSQSVLLTRLDLTAPAGSGALPALQITGVLGNLRIQDSTITGAKPNSYNGVNGPGVGIVSSLNIVFSSCSIQGGFSQASWGGEEPVDGGIGVDSIDSSVALYDCTVRGGNGSQESSPSGGNGGDAYRCTGFGLFAAGSTLQGGHGGGGDYVGCNTGGTGADGLRVDAAQVHLLETTCLAGSGGWSSCGPPGAPGQTIVALNGSIIDPMVGTRRKISVERICADDASVPITITGQPGDTVYLMLARRPSFVFKKILNGAWMLPTPMFSNGLPAGTIGANGTLVVQRSFAIQDGTVAARTHWLQAMCVDTAGKATLTGPAHVLSLDAASAPDCNGNGRQDVLDVLFGGAPDCDGNLTPDACEADCNGNGILDTCDIAAHSSSDVNGNGIPDECEAQFLTWYVDAAAPPGGNGSQASPFNSLQSGVSASFHGDTVIVADGTYSGAGNRNVNLSGRSITIRSANGPANCTIHCQDLGRAFSMILNEQVTIEGIAFVDGRVSNGGGAIQARGARLTLRNCRFTSCFARQDGGAVNAILGSLYVDACDFIDNSSIDGNFGYGGALFADGNALKVRDCSFVNNQAGVGGAFYIRWFTAPPPEAVLMHSTFLGNHSLSFGGAGFVQDSPVGVVHRIDDCLFAGNSAASSGGALRSEGALAITNCTFTSNTAVDKGGAIHLIDQPSSTIHNSIAWGDSAGTGPEICLGANFGPITGLSVAHSAIQGGQAGVAVLQGALTWGAGNLALDPQFSDPDGPDNNLATLGDNDYGLSLISPCVDAGDSDALIPDLLDVDGDGNTTEQVPLDLRHLPRRVDVLAVPDTGAGTAPIVDMGALERQG